MLVTSSRDQHRRLSGQRSRDGEPLQFAPGESAGVPLGEPVQTDLGEQPVHVGGACPGRGAPNTDVVGDSTPEYLALRMLHDDGGATRLTEADGTRAQKSSPRSAGGPTTAASTSSCPNRWGR